MIVYIATFPNGKRYIGATSQGLDKRKGDHLSASKAGVRNKFYNAIRKHGFENVTWEIHSFHDTSEDMFAMERHLISVLNAQKHGYNSTTGGEGVPGRIFTEHDREKIGIAQRKRFKCDQQRERSRLGMLEWIRENPDIHKKHSERRASTIRKVEVREKIAKGLQKHLRDNPDRLREQAIKIYATRPEIKEKISRSLGGRPVSVWKNGKLVGVFPTLCECARSVGSSVGNIGMVINGKRSHAKGFQFTREAA